MIPGLVNTHHHMYQSLTRAVPAAQNAELFGWLTSLYKIWANLTPEMIEVSTLTAMAELLLSGCTTSSDHLYIYPNGSRLDDSIAAARQIGMRFHAARGSMSVGQKDGGLPPDSVVEKEDAHPEGHAAPDRDVSRRRPLRDAARRRRAVLAVLGEPRPDARIGGAGAAVRRIDAYASRRERERRRVQPREVRHVAGRVCGGSGLGRTAMCGTRIVCSWTARVSNCLGAPGRASRIARVRTCGWRRASRRSGRCATRACRSASASTDRHRTTARRWWREVRQALLLQRVGFGPDAMSAREALEIATLGGAKVLGRDDIGALAPGMAADFVSFDLSQHGFAGALARSRRGAGVLRAVAGIDECDRRQGGRARRSVDDGRSRTDRRTAQPAGGSADRRWPTD